MLPEHIKDDRRLAQYQEEHYIYNGEHYQVFNINEQEKKVNDYEYICYNIINQAINIKTDLIWRESPNITFQNQKTQKEFDRLRKDTSFDFINRQATAYSYLFGDSILKVAVDNNNQTTKLDDLELRLYLIDPAIWSPQYNPFNPQIEAKVNTLIFKKEVKDVGEVYLLESHQPGQIIWTSFLQEPKEDEAKQIPVLKYFNEEMEGVVAESGADENSLEIVYNTDCTYSLLQRLKNKTDIKSYFGQSMLNLPVKSKLNALNNYANLADVIIVTNAFPKLILSENASNILKRIVEEYNTGSNTNLETDATGEVGSLDDNLDLTTLNGKTFLSRQTYANSYIYRKLVNDMRVFEDGSKGGQTKYLTNDFSLEEIRKQHDVYFNTLMAELDIAEVFYNPNLITGNLSGVAYKRLMSRTLNAVDNTKRNLERFLAIQAMTMLELANNNNLTNVKIEMPEVTFNDGIINDEKEELDLIVSKVQNDLLPIKEAMAQANKVGIDQVETWLEEFAGSADVVDQPIDENQTDLTNV